MTLVEGTLLAIVGAITFLDRWPAVQSMVSRPLVVGPAVGAVLGDVGAGVVWGAVFEAAFLGLLPVGAARVPDASLAALTGTVVAIEGAAGGAPPAGLAVALGLAAGFLGERADRWHRRWNGRTAARVEARVGAGDLGAPGRGIAAALARATVFGALRAVVAIGVALGAVELLAGTAWAAPLDGRGIRLAAGAALAVAGAAAFARGRWAAWGAGLGVGAVVAWLGIGM